MAIAPTGAIYKSLVFDGEDSRNYGVYITGQAVYNAPGRDVEMVEIPGRNGSFALDKGRFQNIEVSYPAGIFADNEADFAEAISDFRNFLCSRNGYVRLTDEYNPNEYRMAIYKSGLEVTPAQLKAGEFEIIFDCKPQRWLTSGETAITVSSGDTVTNPTLFESSPMLEVEGYGNIDFNGYNITLDNATLGNVVLMESTAGPASNVVNWTSPIFDGALYNVNDVITRYSSTYIIDVTAKGTNTLNHIFVPGGEIYPFDVSCQKLSAYTWRAVITTQVLSSDVISQSSTLWTKVYSPHFYIYLNDSDMTSAEDFIIEIRESWTRPSTNQKWSQIGIQMNITESQYTTLGVQDIQIGRVSVNSTVSVLGNPVYIDCDIGGAYKIEDGSTVSLNSYIDLGSELPTLAAGANEITCDNTVTELKIIPRWWKV